MYRVFFLVVCVLLATLGHAQTMPERPAFTTGDASRYGRELMEYADAYDSGWVDEVFQGEMALIDAAGRSVTRGFVRLGLERAPEGDKVISRFTQPNDIRGVAALTFENRGASDDNWLYLPATKRVRRVSGANNRSSFQGTEFTFEDLSALDTQEYEFTYQGEEAITVDGESRQAHKIDAVPTYEDTGYSRLTIFLDPLTWVQVKVDYYDLAGVFLKTRLASELELFHERYWRAQRVEMVNHQTGKRTVLSIDGHFVNLSKYPDARTGAPRQNLTESVFTTRALVQ